MKAAVRMRQIFSKLLLYVLTLQCALAVPAKSVRVKAAAVLWHGRCGLSKTVRAIRRVGQRGPVLAAWQELPEFPPAHRLLTQVAG
jgi:hypothetical protein